MEKSFLTDNRTDHRPVYIFMVQRIVQYAEHITHEGKSRGIGNRAFGYDIRRRSI